MQFVQPSEELLFGTNLSSLILKKFDTKKETGDFIIKCNDRSIPCHKLILASSSPVFRAMIRSNMKERKHGEMVLDSFSFETASAMIKFFYKKDIPKNMKIQDILNPKTNKKQTRDTDQSQFLSSIFGSRSNRVVNKVDYNELLRAADFFQVPLLKKVCEYSLVNGLTKNSVLDVYKMAKMYNADILMKDAKEMIIRSKTEIMSGGEWKEKLKDLNDPDLMIEMLAIGNPQQKYQHPQQQYQQPQQQYQQPQPSFDRWTSTRPQSRQSQRQIQLNYMDDNSDSDNDQLEIQPQPQQLGCYMTEMEGSRYTGKMKHTTLCQEVLDDMLINFAALYNDEDTADLTCSMNNENVVIHKAVLKLYSLPLFNKLSTNVQINEIERDVLKFLYTGKIAEYDKKAEKLIELAHTFNIPLLRSYCENTLIATLSVDNVLERFIVASKNECAGLRKKSLALMKKEKKNILKTDNWRNLIKNNVDIIFELLLEVF